MPNDLKKGAPLGDAAPMEARQLVDGDALAKLLSVSERTIKRLYRSNRIPWVPVGDRVRFDPIEVIAHLKQQAAAAKDEKK